MFIVNGQTNHQSLWVARFVLRRKSGETTSFPSFDHGWGGDSGGRVRRIWAPFAGQMECQSSASTQMRCPPRGEPRCFPVMRLCCSWPTLGALGIFCPFTPPHPLAPRHIPLWLLMIPPPHFPLAPQVYYLYLLPDPLFSSFLHVFQLEFKFCQALFASYSLYSKIFSNTEDWRRRWDLVDCIFLHFETNNNLAYNVSISYCRPPACEETIATHYTQIKIKPNWVRLITDKWGSKPLHLCNQKPAFVRKTSQCTLFKHLYFIWLHRFHQ